ncbi:hypothetical protein CSKR_112039 [Clonorchis sinensis]|uniref:Apple domain-containing protein n=1 Tax=Clonorchis sinensis TaxID=79923 RepID=A0A8T1MNJ8_CLOSI|nr:hypothetical protein CSKR_112039 [Clonorchis sinensis]
MYHLFTLIILPILKVQSSCPLGYENLWSDVCIAQLGEASHFCTACEECAEYGARNGELAFLMGKEILRDFPPDLRHWTGFNRLLTQSMTSNGVWRDVDPRSSDYKIQSSEMSWRFGEPSNEPVVIFDGHPSGLEGTTMDQDSNSPWVSCVFGGLLSDLRLSHRFRSDFPEPITNIIQTDDAYSGCFMEVQSPTHIACARKCALNPHCRSIYFHAKDKRCIQMLYADALLPTGISPNQDGWKRSAKATVMEN